MTALNTTESEPSTPCVSAFPPGTVFVNVYDIIDANSLLVSLGVGLHHAGVEVYGMEMQFGACDSGTGVSVTPPRHVQPHTLREQFALGITDRTKEEVQELIADLEDDLAWQGSTYHIIEHNCLHFVQCVLPQLLSVSCRREAWHDSRFWSGGAMEAVDDMGHTVMLPSLLPPHVNRVPKLAETYGPSWLINGIKSVTSGHASSSLSSSGHASIPLPSSGNWPSGTMETLRGLWRSRSAERSTSAESHTYM